MARSSFFVNLAKSFRWKQATRRKERSLAIEQLEDRRMMTVAIKFDYSFDRTHFCEGHRRAVLEAAGKEIGDRINDNLAAIAPSGRNYWTVRFNDPSTGKATSRNNLSVPKDTIIVYVGARPMSWLGDMSSGASGGGSCAWKDTFQTRDQPGTSTWGGSIAFDSTPAHPWYYGVSASVPKGHLDFYSTVQHELGHLLGVDGDNPHFRNQISQRAFTGTAAKAANGGSTVPMHNNENDHWARSVKSNGRTATMSYEPRAPGVARRFTELDFAALKDIGWEVNAHAVSVEARFDHDLKADHVVWRSAYGNWYPRLSSNGATYKWQYGLPGDIPVNGDFRGNGLSDLAVWRPANGIWYVNGKPPQQFGLPGDVPVPGDYDGDGQDDFAVYRPSNGRWYIKYARGGHYVRHWGRAGDLPQPADFDGDGRVDISVWRPSTGQWFAIQSSTNRSLIRQWGLPDDIPVTNAAAALRRSYLFARSDLRRNVECTARGGERSPVGSGFAT